MNLRLCAARVIVHVMKGHALRDQLPIALFSIGDARDRAWVQSVCYDICRFYPRYMAILNDLLKKPLKAKDQDITALMLVGLHQLEAMRVPSHAALMETVNALDDMKKPWAKGLVNAVCRQFLRDREAIRHRIDTNDESHFAHPAWLIDQIKKNWPNHFQTILLENNKHPPFSIRIHDMKREDYLKICAAHNITAKIISETESGVMLDTPLSVDALPQF